MYKFIGYNNGVFMLTKKYKRYIVIDTEFKIIYIFFIVISLYTKL